MQLTHAFRLSGKDVVVLVGGGGKTTLMFRLADELLEAGHRVVTSMTTKIFVSQMTRAPARLVLEGERTLLAQLPQALADHGHVLVAGGTIVEQDKVAGVPPHVVDRIAAQPAVEAVLVEADGSRRLPFKAPAPHEPVIPPSATVVVPVVGADAVGAALTPEHVHRPQLVAALTGVPLGAPVTPEMIATVLAHPDGGAKGLPPGARLMPFINKVEDAASLAAARQIARLLLAQPVVDAVLIGAGQAADPVREVWSRVGAIVLAAGAARRFGALKQLLPWRGAPLVAHVTAQAAACADVAQVVVTVGAEAATVIEALEDDDRAAGGAGQSMRVALAVVAVPDWALGQSRSVRAGLTALTAAPVIRKAGHAIASWGGFSATLFLLADQPGVSPELLSALIRRHRETLAPIVAPRYRGQRGNPVLFDRATFPEIARLSGDIGARPVIRAHQAEIAWVDWPSEEVIQDIDTPDDYLAALPAG